MIDNFRITKIVKERIDLRIKQASPIIKWFIKSLRPIIEEIAKESLKAYLEKELN